MWRLRIGSRVATLTRFMLVGGLDLNPNSIAKNELDKWSADGVVEYLGRLEDVRPAIRLSSVFVLPSYYREGVPRTILEAMAMGRAVITTDAPGCRETVIEASNGLLVRTKDVESLQQAMQKFLDDDSLAQRMGLRSRKMAEEKYDVHKVNRVILKEMGIS